MATVPGGVEGSKTQAFIAEALALAQAQMSAEAAAVSGYRLFWVREGAVDWVDLEAGGPHAILGSHPLCDAVWPDPGIFLRHVLAATVTLADGPALRLLDLHTDTPFRLQDGSLQWSILGAGTVVAQLGRTVFGGVPIEAGQAPAAPAGASLPVLSIAASARPELPPKPTEGTGRRARITSMPPSSRIGHAPPPTAPPRGPGMLSPPEADGPPGRRWEVTVERADRSATVAFTDAALSVGVVVGRSPNCHDEGLRAVLDTSISRGHLLLLHQHDTYEAFDLRSTNGTWEDGRRVLRRRLGEEPVTLALSTWTPAVLRWRGGGA